MFGGPENEFVASEVQSLPGPSGKRRVLFFVLASLFGFASLSTAANGVMAVALGKFVALPASALFAFLFFAGWVACTERWKYSEIQLDRIIERWADERLREYCKEHCVAHQKSSIPTQYSDLSTVDLFRVASKINRDVAPEAHQQLLQTVQERLTSAHSS